VCWTGRSPSPPRVRARFPSRWSTSPRLGRCCTWPEGQLDAALTSARKAIEFGAQSRFRLELGAAQRVLGQVLEASGDHAQAGAALAQSLETFEEIQSLPELGQTLLAYGRFKLGDDAAEGQRLITRARGIFARMGAVGWVAETDTAPGPR